MDLTRRELITTGISAGIALAAHPLIAESLVTTDSKQLVTKTIDVTATDGKFSAYVARPEKGNQLPVVLVCHEIFGVHAYIQDVCRRFAKAGYLAVAPNLFSRQGDATKVSNVEELFAKIVSKASMSQVMTDLDATLAAAKKEKGAVDRAAVMGYCWGGKTAWLYAAHNPKLKAAVAWYGPVEGQISPLHPQFPVDVAAQLKVPTLGIYAGKDTHIPLTGVNKLEAKLKEGKSGSEIVIFPEATHGFHADYRPSFKADDAKAAWMKMLDWLKTHGCA